MNTDNRNKSTIPTSQGSSQDKLLSLLKAVALVVVILGALGSFGFVLREGRGAPLFLLLLFIGWVLSPFIAFLLISTFTRRWPTIARELLYGATLVLTLSSLIIYGFVSLRPHLSTPTAFFLLVPLGSWFLMGIAAAITAVVFGRLSRRD